MRYDITGIDVNGRRFSFSTINYTHAMGYNLWRGSVWKVTKEIGTKTVKRELIKRVIN